MPEPGGIGMNLEGQPVSRRDRDTVGFNPENNSQNPLRRTVRELGPTGAGGEGRPTTITQWRELAKNGQPWEVAQAENKIKELKALAEKMGANQILEEAERQAKTENRLFTTEEANQALALGLVRRVPQEKDEQPQFVLNAKALEGYGEDWVQQRQVIIPRPSDIVTVEERKAGGNQTPPKPPEEPKKEKEPETGNTGDVAGAIAKGAAELAAADVAGRVIGEAAEGAVEAGLRSAAERAREKRREVRGRKAGSKEKSEEASRTIGDERIDREKNEPDVKGQDYDSALDVFMDMAIDLQAVGDNDRERARILKEMRPVIFGISYENLAILLKNETDEGIFRILKAEKQNRVDQINQQGLYVLSKSHVEQLLRDELAVADPTDFNTRLPKIADREEDVARGKGPAGVKDYINNPRLTGVVYDILHEEADMVITTIYIDNPDLARAKGVSEEGAKSDFDSLKRRGLGIATIRNPGGIMAELNENELKRLADLSYPGAAEKLALAIRQRQEREARQSQQGRRMSGEVQSGGNEIEIASIDELKRNLNRYEREVQHPQNAWLSAEMLKTWTIPLVAPVRGETLTDPITVQSTVDLINKKFGEWATLTDAEEAAIRWALSNAKDRNLTRPLTDLINMHFRIGSTATIDVMFMEGGATKEKFLFAQIWDILSKRGTETRKVLGPMMAVVFEEDPFDGDDGKQMAKNKEDLSAKLIDGHTVRLINGARVNSLEDYKNEAEKAIRAVYGRIGNGHKDAAKDFAKTVRQWYPEVFYENGDGMQDAVIIPKKREMEEVLAKAMGVSRGAVDLASSYTRTWGGDEAWFRWAQMKYYYPQGNEYLWRMGIMPNIQMEGGRDLSYYFKANILDQMNSGSEADYERYGERLKSLSVETFIGKWAGFGELLTAMNDIRLAASGKKGNPYSTLSGVGAVDRRISLILDADAAQKVKADIGIFKIPTWRGFDGTKVYDIVKAGLYLMKERGQLPSKPPSIELSKREFINEKGHTDWGAVWREVWSRAWKPNDK